MVKDVPSQIANRAEEVAPVLDGRRITRRPVEDRWCKKLVESKGYFH
jgi:hypothetical protein